MLCSVMCGGNENPSVELGAGRSFRQQTDKSSRKKLPGDGEFLGRFCCNWKVTEHIESRFGDLQGHLQGHSGKGELFMNFFYLVVGVCIPVGIITLKFLSSEELKVFVNIQ